MYTLLDLWCRGFIYYTDLLVEAEWRDVGLQGEQVPVQDETHARNHGLHVSSHRPDSRLH